MKEINSFFHTFVSISENKYMIIVNVKTSSGAIEQRLKIIKSESLGQYAWDESNGATVSVK